MSKLNVFLSAAIAAISAALVAVSLTPDPAAAAGKGEKVEFAAAVTPPSDLRQRMAKQAGKTAEVFDTGRVKGFLYRAKAGGPAVILAPSCLGVKEFHHDWARRLTDWGYTALIVDSPGSRGLEENCAGENMTGFRKAGLDNRVYDFYGAHAYLSDSAGADPKRIAVMGWGYSGILTAVLETGVYRLFDARFAGVVAYYPPCRTAPTGNFIAPALILSGGQDDWSPLARCQTMKASGEGGASAIELVVYGDARHGFDNPAIGDKVYRPEVWNPNKMPTRGATLAYNAYASNNGRERVKAFLEQRF